MAKQAISIAALNALNDAIWVLEDRGHKDAAKQLVAIWDAELEASEEAHGEVQVAA